MKKPTLILIGSAVGSAVAGFVSGYFAGRPNKEGRAVLETIAKEKAKAAEEQKKYEESLKGNDSKAS